ncbi:MAG: TolC family protein [Phycisphaerales bacterium]
MRPAAALMLTGLTGLSMLAGCRSPLGPGSSTWTPAMDRLRTIEPVQLESFVAGAPQSVAEGLARLDERVAGVASETAGTSAETTGTMPLRLEDVRAASLAHNLELDVRRVDPELATQRIREARARFEAVFNGGVRWSRTDQAVALATEGAQSETLSFDVGVSAPLRSGADVSLTIPVVENKTNNPFSLLNPATSADVRFQIRQPLLRGAGTFVNTYDLQVARLESDVTATQTRLAATRVLAEADRAYWRHYAARRNLDVTVQQLELAREQEARARRRVAAQTAAEVEILRAQSGVAERVEAVIVAENALRRQRRDLKRIMNRPDLPQAGSATLEPATEPEPVGLELDADRLVELALDRRMELLEFEIRLAIDRKTIELRRNERLPQLTLDYTYNINGLGRSYNEAFDQLPPRSFDDWSVGLQASVPIGNEAARSRYEQALLSRLQRLATREQRVSAITGEVLDATDAVEQAWLRILAARREVQLAGRTLEAEERQFEVGLRTSTDVLDAASRLALASFREIQAITDYQVSQVDLAFATGTVLGFTGIEWMDAGER